MLDEEALKNQISIYMKLIQTGYLKPKNGFLYKNKLEIYKNYEKTLSISLDYDNRWNMNPYDSHFSAIFQDAGLYGLITEDFIDNLAEYLEGKRVLEVMAGSGNISLALKDRGIDVIATDDKSWEIPNEDSIEIEELDAVLAVKKYGKNIDYVIMSWSPINNQIDNEVLIELRKINPEATIIVIGEVGGCTGSKEFQKNIKFYQDVNFYNVQKSYESWGYFNDGAFLVK